MNKFIKKGFTLIELLIVITIIAIITSIGAASMITAQKQARDSARREIISNVQSAYEQYFAETGTYPYLNPSAAFENSTVPKDPKDTGVYTINWSSITTDTYCVCATMELSYGNAANQACTTWSDTGAYYCAKNRQ